MPVALGVNGGVLGSNNLPTATTYKGIFTPNEVARAIALGFWPVNKSQSVTGVAGVGALGTLTIGTNADPYFNLTTLLLSTTATNGQQNNTFQDSSTNNFTITRNPATGPNAPTQGTFSPFSQTGWGNYFDGTGDYLSGNTNLWATTTSTFTVDGWVYPTSTPGAKNVLLGDFSPTGATLYIGVYINSSRQLVMEWYDGGTKTCTSTSTINLNEWSYVAVRVSSNAISMYVNSATASGLSGATTLTNRAGTTNWTIGQYASGNNWNGYISNLRMSTVARTIAIPTAPFTPDADTKLLTCQSNRFVDTSSNAYSVTPSSNTSVVPFSPFNPTSAWSASTIGGSGYFDGTGDYLSTPSSSAFSFGTGDFTIEYWVYVNSGTNNGIFQLSDTAGGLKPSQANSLAMNIFTNNSVSIYANGTSYQAANNTLPYNSWTHFAIVRSSNVTKLYANGSLVTSIGSSGSITDNTNYTGLYVAVGGYYSTAYLMTGYVSNFRVVKGTAVYTSNFTPPTAPLTAITNTSLLLNFTNSGIYDATAKNVLETVGDAQASTAITPKWGTTSMKFDPTTGSATDYLQSPDTELLEFGSGNFTIETWVRFNTLPSSGAYYALISKFDNSTQKSYNFYVYNNAGTYQLYFTYTTNGSTNINPVASGITVTTNTWYHYAVSRSGVNLRMFIDGSQVGSTYNIATDTIFGGTYPVQVGASTGANTLNGYLQDLRVTKGYARYTANFTPPTAAFPVQ